MNYTIYFDESNKLDQPNGGYSYYGAFGTSEVKMNQIIENIKCITNSKSELHFAEYTSDTNFGNYFKALDYVIKQDININIFIINNEDAKNIADKMGITMTQFRELFYVKIPERLFYGVTRNLKNGEQVRIVVDENEEYETWNVYTKLEEQMNAHSAYRNKGYKVNSVTPESSEKSIPLQIIDVFMGIVVFLLEKHYKNVNEKNDDITLKVKSDLIYRFLIQDENLNLFQSKITLFKWEGNSDQIQDVKISDFTSEFIIDKTHYDIKELNYLQKLMIENPGEETRFYREKMGYKNRELKKIQGYIDVINGKGRNSFFIKDV
ncbi:DUF3800 domain-containing protein [Robertmurraya massiliosenegalensis]|uniref:DUF3800 domain-containing protein n=1 Tax=Robertmurraya massiliosenegalensis TaxID=1287657 RepID=UPI0003813690|nr:DUF3800 domain-containing protein [Robertmurraya massiliosenegalensis]